MAHTGNQAGATVSALVPPKQQQTVAPAPTILVAPLDHLCPACLGLGHTVEQHSGRTHPCTCTRGIVPAECDQCQADLTDSCDASCDDTVSGFAVRAYREPSGAPDDGGDVLDSRCCGKCLLSVLVDAVRWIGADESIAWSGVELVVSDAAVAVARAQEAKLTAELATGLAIGNAIGRAVYGGRS